MTFGINQSRNDNSARVYQSVQSVSGNGMADIVQTSGNDLTVVAANRKGFSEQYTITGIEDISRNRSDVSGSGGSIGAAGTLNIRRNAQGKSISVGINGGGGGSYALGTNWQTAGFVDMNGDGLPDYVDHTSGSAKSKIKMNLGRNKWEDGKLALFTPYDISKGSSDKKIPFSSVKLRVLRGKILGYDYGGNVSNVYEMITDPLGNVSFGYRDGRGNTRRRQSEVCTTFRESG